MDEAICENLWGISILVTGLCVLFGPSLVEYVHVRRSRIVQEYWLRVAQAEAKAKRFADAAHYEVEKGAHR